MELNNRLDGDDKKPKPPFDLPRKTALASLLIILTLYAAGTIREIWNGEDYLDWNRERHAIEEFNLSYVTDHPAAPHLRTLIPKLSLELFHNQKVFAFSISVALVWLSYLMGKQVSGRYLGGVLSSLILSTSNFYKLFDTSAVYDYSWIILFMGALYLVGTRWKISLLLFVVSLFCKPLTLVFLPTLLFWLYKSELSKQDKWKYFGVILALGISFFVVSQYSGYVAQSGISIDGFIHGAQSWWWFLISDFWITIMLPVMMVATGALITKKTPWASQVFVGMINLAFYGAFTEGLVSAFIANEAYRYIPLLVIFSISFGVFFRVKRTVRVKH